MAARVVPDFGSTQAAPRDSAVALMSANVQFWDLSDQTETINLLDGSWKKTYRYLISGSVLYVTLIAASFETPRIAPGEVLLDPGVDPGCCEFGTFASLVDLSEDRFPRTPPTAPPIAAQIRTPISTHTQRNRFHFGAGVVSPRSASPIS